MKITKEDLLEKLEQLDERLVTIWLNEDNAVTDEEMWDIFVILLETRIELLKSCKDAGIKLSQDVCLPPWLDRLVNRRQEIRLRDLRTVSRELEQRRKIRAYERRVGGKVKPAILDGIDEGV